MNFSDLTSTLTLRTDSDGVVRMGHTRISLDTIIQAFKDGSSSEEIVIQYPVLELADVYAVIGFYLKNRVEVDAYLTREESDAAIIRASVEQVFPMVSIREMLLNRRDAAASASL